jgi:hypothetical protein
MAVVVNSDDERCYDQGPDAGNFERRRRASFGVANSQKLTRGVVGNDISPALARRAPALSIDPRERGQHFVARRLPR